MMSLDDLKAIATRHGVEVVDRGYGHFQLKGVLLVNFYPNARKPSAYVAGTTAGKKMVTADEACRMALQPPAMVNRAEKARRKAQTKTKYRLIARIESVAPSVDGKYFCIWCADRFLPSELTVEHVIPLARGGLNNDNNRALACAPCNTTRGHAMPEITGGAKAMDNQHQKITGYRELNQGEIDLMNAIKALGAEATTLLRRVDAHLADQTRIALEDVAAGGTKDEVTRIAAAEPLRWRSIAKTDIQTALMALTRAVAQPSSF